MNLRPIGFVILLFISGNNLISVYAQDVRVLRQSEKSFPKGKSKAPLHFIEPAMDTTRLAYVATLEISSPGNPSLMAIYDKGKAEAIKLGANAIKFRNFDQAQITLIVDAYFASEQALEQNEMHKPFNTLYVFAGDLYDKSGYYSFEFNGAAKTLKNGTYFKYTLKEGEQVKLKKGTVTGTTKWVKWKPNEMPNYLSIHGFSKDAVVKRTSVSQPSKPGKFANVESGLGALLVQLLEQKVD